MLRHISAVPGAALIALCTAAPALAADEAAVVVTATRQPMRVNELLSDITVIESEDIVRAGQTTLAGFLATQPGVQITENGSSGATSNVMLRGANAGHTLVLIDGLRVGSATLGNVSWSRLPLAQIERIEILRGPASSLYGSDALGGVVQIFTRRGDGDPRFNADIGAGSYGTTSSGIGASGSTGGLRYSFGATQFRTDGFNSIRNARNTSYNPDADGFADESVRANLSYELAPGHEVGINAFQSDGRNRYDNRSISAPVTPASNSYENGLTVQNYGATLRNRLAGGWNSTLRMGRAVDDSTAYSNGTMTDAARTDQSQLNWQHDVRLAGGNLLLGWERLDQRISSTRAYTLKSRSAKSLLAGWTGRIGSHRLQANLRRDDNSQFGGRNTGSLAWGYQFDDYWRGRAAAGTAFLAPTFNDLYYPLKSNQVGNPDLKPELAQSRELAVHYERSGYQASVTWYLNRVTDLISWSGVNAAGNTIPINIGRARLEGVTVAASATVADYDINVSLDHLEARDKATDKRLRRRAREHMNVGIGRSVGPWQWRSELKFVGGRFDDDANAKHLGGHSLVNLQGSYAFARNWSLFARVNNVFDKKYELLADFATSGANLFIGLRYAPQ